MSIVVRNVSKRYGASQVAALHDVCLEVPGGALVALLGPSGSGKTTLLRILAGLEQPDAGSTAIDGSDLGAQTARQRNVGLVFQHYALFRHLSVFENVAFALRVRKAPKQEVQARVDELLRLVQLEGHGDRLPSQLSGGQRQRVALARALAARPRVLLLDEPFGALDAQVRAELRAWLRRLHDEIHITTVFVTHDQDEAFDVADQVVVMNHGRIEQVGAPAEVFEQPANDFVMRFLGHVNVLDRDDGRVYVRPHELELSRTTGEIAARVVRVTPIGGGLKVELAAPQLPPLRADIAWEQASQLGLKADDHIFISLRRTRVFDAAA